MSGFLLGTDPTLRKTKTPTVDTFAHGVGFTAGSSNSVTLSADPGSENNLTVFFDGVGQHKSTYSVSGTTLTFDTTIPSGVAEIEATYASTVSSLTVPDASVATAKLVDGAVTAAKLDGAAAASVTDMRLAFLMIAENQGDRLNMDDGIADPFKDETDVDTSTSTNETYDATGDYYTSLGADTALDLSGLTETADGIGAVTRTAAKFDGTTVQNIASSTIWNTDATAFAFGVDHGSGNTRVIKSATYTCPTDSNGGFFAASSGGNLTFKMQGSTDDSSWVDLGGNLTDDFPFADSGRAVSHTMTSTTAYRYHRVHVTKNSGSAGYLRLAEAQFFVAGSAVNMTLVSNAFTAASAPATGRIHIQVNAVDSITINSDLTAEISRNGGTSWTAATLVLKETLKDGTVAYEDSSVSLTSQSSGTSMKYRIKTLNTKQVQVHGVVLQWA